MSRAMARVGFSPTRWKGARKMPNLSPRWVIVSASLLADSLRRSSRQHQGRGPREALRPGKGAQEKTADQQRDQGQGDAHAAVLAEPDLDPGSTRGFHDDEVGHRAHEGEVSG